MPNPEQHVGLPLLDAERSKLLSDYDTAVKQVSDDPVKTDHGNVAEALFRSFLAQFLPKKLGVTKGHIITPELNYAGPLEEWDIIIYDALQSPVLFVRRDKDDAEHAGRRGIPIEYVHAVVEVKATLNPQMATAVAEKLLKLTPMCTPRRPSHPMDHPSKLPENFFCTSIFFETKVKSPKDFSKALGAFAKLYQVEHAPNFWGGLILRSQNQPENSAIFEMWETSNDEDDPMGPEFETSPKFTTFTPDGTEERFGNITSCGFGPNAFWTFMLSLSQHLGYQRPDAPTKYISLGRYGRKVGHPSTHTLFPPH
jgi:hypothetical protein